MVESKIANRKSKIWKGGDSKCRVSKFENLLRFRPVRGELPN